MKMSTILSFLLCSIITITAQKRDYLTEREAELIRLNQALDARIVIYIQAIERRIKILQGRQLSEKEIEKFGVPEGNHSDLLNDIPRILLESIEKIEDVVERNPKSELIMKSTKTLAEACQKFDREFQVFLQKYTSNKEQAAVLSALEYCQQVKEAIQKKN